MRYGQRAGVVEVECNAFGSPTQKGRILTVSRQPDPPQNRGNGPQILQHLFHVMQ